MRTPLRAAARATEPRGASADDGLGRAGTGGCLEHEVTPSFLTLKKSSGIHFLESRSLCFLLRQSIGGGACVSKIYDYLQSGLKVLDDIV